MDFISNFAYPLVFRNHETFEKYVKKFSEKVEIRPIVAGNITDQPFFIPFKGEERCPNAEKIHNLGFYFPNREDLTEEEVFSK
jgi:dTDP-4-amino-4,6-dideoxygalactose transaminase